MAAFVLSLFTALSLAFASPPHGVDVSYCQTDSNTWYVAEDHQLFGPYASVGDALRAIAADADGGMRIKSLTNC